MIVFDKLWITMKEKGISSYVIREKYGLDGKTMRRLKTNQNMTTGTLNKFCEILDCKLEDIATYIKD